MVTDEDRKAAAAWARKQGRSLQEEIMMDEIMCDVPGLAAEYPRGMADLDYEADAIEAWEHLK